MSRRRPSRKKYAETIGEVVIGWNLLERRVNHLAFHYLGGDTGVASRLLQSMGNQTKEEFLRYLVQRFEQDEEISITVKHFVKGTSILRENRNTLIHASPMNVSNRYQGKVAKPHKDGRIQHFNVPIEDLEENANLIRRFEEYGKWIAVCLSSPDNDGSEGGPSTKKAVRTALSSSLTTPPLPRKLAPLQLPQDHAVS